MEHSRTSKSFFTRAVVSVLLSAAVVAGIFLAFFSAILHQFMNYADVQRKGDLMRVVTVARNAIEPIVANVRSGRLSREEGIQKARALARLMVYSDQYGSNYIFMSAYDGTMLVQPFEPEKELTNQLELRDDRGNFIIQKLIDMARSPEGCGFVVYYYPPPKSTASEGKMAYVIGIPELQCYMGTGMYLQQAYKQQHQLLKMARMVSALLIALLLVPILFAVRQLYAHNKELRLQIETREKAEAALHEREETFRALSENSLDVIMRFGKDLRHLYVNPVVKQHTGMPPEEFIGKTHEELGFPAGLCSFWGDAIREVFSSGRNKRLEFQLPAGAWIDWLLMPECGADGSVHAVITSARDITERKTAEKALQDREIYYRTVFESSNDALFILRDTDIIACNTAALKVYGADSRDSLIGKSALSLSPPVQPDGRDSARAAAAYIEAACSGAPQYLEWELLRADGTPFTAEVMLNRIEIADEMLLFSSVRDISVQRKLKEQLQQAQKMESIGRLAGGVAHDYNNMLSVILGYADLALEKVPPEQPLHADIAEIQKAAVRSMNITRQLLAFARKQAIVPKTLDLNDTVEGMLKMLRHLIGENLELTWLPGTSLWPVCMDPAQIDQILANLCVNARDAIADVGKIVIETQNVFLDDSSMAGQAGFIPGPFVLLGIRDTGCGMDDETVAQIFDPFFTTKSVGEGTGLGLATVYGIVKQNRGFIEVQSEPGLGTVFRIFLPRSENAPPSVQEPVTTAAISRMQGETILVVEDEPAILTMAQRILMRQGYSVLVAGTSKEAIHLAQEYTGDIVLLLSDVIMPEMSGKDLARELQTLRPGMKCLFMSGYTANIIGSKGILDTCVNFIQKPFTMRQLSEKVHAILCTTPLDDA